MKRLQFWWVADDGWRWADNFADSPLPARCRRPNNANTTPQAVIDLEKPKPVSVLGFAV